MEKEDRLKKAFGYVGARRALDLSEKDGSIVLTAGSMFVTAEVMKAWNKINRGDGS